jgi:hypothetical protein
VKYNVLTPGGRADDPNTNLVITRGRDAVATIEGERPKLWTPQGAHLQTLMEDFEKAEYQAHGAQHFPTKPIVDAKGNVLVIRPLNLVEEVECFLREERLKSYAREIGLKYIGGEAAAGAWVFPNGARTNLLNGTFDIDTDSFKQALFLSTSNLGLTSTTFAGVTNEHAAANGYTAGGIAVALTLAGTTTVTVDITTDPVWTASGGSIVARFACIYEVAGSVLCYALLDATPADVTATTGNTLTVATNASGVFTLA